MLYQHIQKLCDDRGLTILQLSQLTGISKNTLYKWDDIVPRESSIEKVAEVLHVSSESLLLKVKAKTRKCPKCGKIFVLKSGMTQQKIYCSTECRKASKEKKSGKSNFAVKTEKAREMFVSYGIYTAIKDGYIKGVNLCQGFQKTDTTNFTPVKVVLIGR